MKSGTVAVIGKANAGKSTLINVLVGEKVSIVSPKPQTTRERILGILNGENYQVVFADTPGIYRQIKRLSSFMQSQLEQTVKEVDLLLFVLDCHARAEGGEAELIKRYQQTGIPLIVVLSKIDIAPEEKVIEWYACLKEGGVTGNIIPVSARRGKNMSDLKDAIINALPEGDKLFPDDIISDKSEKYMIAEIMREKILLKYDKEIPHGVAITINEFKRRDSGIYDINLDIVCEKAAHKAIIIGKGGGALKETAAFARQDMQKFLGGKVFLTVFVKVEEDWRDKPRLLKEYGYGQFGGKN